MWLHDDADAVRYRGTRCSGGDAVAARAGVPKTVHVRLAATHVNVSQVSGDER